MRLLGELKRLESDEEGASLVFAAMTLLSLTLSILYVYQMGFVSADRIRMQNAADAAAYSAAQVEANALNAIGQVNDAMTYINYLNLRYTVDAIVYSTLNAYEQPPMRPAISTTTGYVLMGGPSAPWEGSARFQHIEKVINGPMKESKNLVVDLHHAARIIMESTPALAMKTAAEIASYNGAARIAFSGDLELAFRENPPEDGTGGDPESYGFVRGGTAPTGGSKARMDLSMAERYGREGFSPFQVARLTPTEANNNDVQPLPSWFDGTKGMEGESGPYAQVRLCWNAKDWEHEGTSPGSLKHSASGGSDRFSRYESGSPNGHWHMRHNHYQWKTLPDGSEIIVFAGRHGGGGSGGTPGSDMPGGGHLDDDQAIHGKKRLLILDTNWKDHHFYAWGGGMSPGCGTCMPYEQDLARFGGIGAFTQIPRSSRNARKLRTQHRLSYEMPNGEFPQPLKIRSSLLRSGITVATWRPAEGIGTTLAASEWGMVAIASAQVGYQTDAGVLPLVDPSSPKAKYDNGKEVRDVRVLGGGPDKEFRNLFFSNEQAKGVRFGARLVPISSKKTYHPDLASDGEAVAQLLSSEGWRWLTPEGGRTVKSGPSDTDATYPDGLETLESIVTVDSDTALKAFWH